MSLHYLVKYPCSKNCHVPQVIEGKCRARLSHSKTVLKHLCGKISIIYFTNKKMFTSTI